MIYKIFFLLTPFLISTAFAIAPSKRIENFSKLYKLETIDKTKKESVQRLINYAKMCQAAFKSDKFIHSLYPKAAIFKGEKNHVKVFIRFNKKIQHQDVIIRGSHGFKNWIENVKLFKKKDRWARGVKVHIGFYNIAREVYSLIKGSLNPNYSTTVSGHSLGGSAAVLVGLYLEHFKFENIKVLSFGQPRVTNKRGAKKLNGFSLQRIAHADDIVTKLPPKIITGYRHFGNLFELDGYKSWTGSFIEDSKDTDEAIDTWKKLESGEIEVQTNIKSHNIINYLKRLNGLLKY